MAAAAAAEHRSGPEPPGVHPRLLEANDPPADLRRRGLRLEYATAVWNVLELAVAITVGLAAGSLALVAFGLDSAIEVFASLVVVWHTRGENEAVAPERSRRALRLIAVAFVLLGVYLVADAGVGLAAGHRPSPSPLGIGVMAATVVVMLGLAWAKRRAGRRMGSRPLMANAAMTFLDGCLAAGVGLALTADLAFGWWWCDAVVAAVVGALALGEGIAGLRGRRAPAPSAPGSGRGASSTRAPGP